MEADINGPQRKVLMSRVRPERAALGTEGITLRDGKTLPFVVYRAWSAPAGHYPDTWYLIDPSSREVFHEGPTRDVLIWGLQALTELTDEVRAPIALAPGTYEIVFALGGLMGGTAPVEVTEAPSTEALAS